MLVRRFRNNSCFQIIGPVAFAVLAPRYPCEELACSYHQITPFKTMKGVNRTSKTQMLGGVGTPLTSNQSYSGTGSPTKTMVVGFMDTSGLVISALSVSKPCSFALPIVAATIADA